MMLQEQSWLFLLHQALFAAAFYSAGNLARSESEWTSKLGYRHNRESVSSKPHKFHSDHHLCPSGYETEPVRALDPLRKPSYKTYAEPCGHNKICRGVRLEYEPVEKLKDYESDFVCCPGWARSSKNSLGCNKAVCNEPCANGGTCILPDTCSCPNGFTGKRCEHAVCSVSCLNGGTCSKDSNKCLCNIGFTGDRCEFDVDECRLLKPCDQTCINTVGKYRCQCRDGFQLKNDGTTCIPTGEYGVAIEADDLEKTNFFSEVDKGRRKQDRGIDSEFSDDPSTRELEAKIDSIQRKIEAINKHQQEQWNQIFKRLDKLQPLLQKITILERKVHHCDQKHNDLYSKRLTMWNDQK